MHKAVVYDVRRLAALALLTVLLLVCGSALAEESMQVRIPVIARGYDCTAALYDSAGHRVQLLQMKDGVASAFNVQCTGLGRFTYTALVTDRDTEDVVYDRTNYRITIDLMYDSDGQIIAMMCIENLVSSEGKLPGMEFINKPTKPVMTPTPALTPTPAPTATPGPTPSSTPGPTATPEYTYRFTFSKVWSGGEHGDSIDWTMYNADGTKRIKAFNKEIISHDIWRYEAYFTSSVADCYVIEVPPPGYTVYYENVGQYSGVTDRCHNGGRIINRRIPQTSDETHLGVYLALILLAAPGLVLISRFWRRSPKSK